MLDLLLDMLRDARRAGVQFDHAWEHATDTLLGDGRSDWRLVLGDTRWAWEAAYRREKAGATIGFIAPLEDTDETAESTGFAVAVA